MPPVRCRRVACVRSRVSGARALRRSRLRARTHANRFRRTAARVDGEPARLPLCARNRCVQRTSPVTRSSANTSCRSCTYTIFASATGVDAELGLAESEKRHRARKRSRLRMVMPEPAAARRAAVTAPAVANATTNLEVESTTIATVVALSRHDSSRRNEECSGARGSSAQRRLDRLGRPASARRDVAGVNRPVDAARFQASRFPGAAARRGRLQPPDGGGRPCARRRSTARSRSRASVGCWTSGQRSPRSRGAGER